MRNAAACVEIDLQIDDDVLEDTLDIIESFLDNLGHIGLIRTAQICIEDGFYGAADLSGPMLTEMVQ